MKLKDKYYKIRYFSSLREISSFEFEWYKLIDGSETYKSNPFLDFGFIKARVESLKGDRKNKPVFAVLYNNGKVAAIAPLLIRKRIGIKYAAMLGEGCYDYGDFLYTSEVQAVALLENIIKDNFIVKFGNLSSNSSIIKIRKYFKYSEVIKICVSPMIRLEKSNFKEKKIKDLNYQERRLSKQGKLSFELAGKKKEQLEKIESFFAMHIKQWKCLGDPSIFEDERNKLLYRSIINNIGKMTKPELSILMHGDMALGMHFGFRCLDTLYYYKPTYNYEYKKHSPGLLLLKKLIENAQMDKIKTIDLMRGDEKYKFDWTREYTQQYSMVIAGSIMKWLLFKGLDILNEARKKALKVLKAR